MACSLPVRMTVRASLSLPRHALRTHTSSVFDGLRIDFAHYNQHAWAYTGRSVVLWLASVWSRASTTMALKHVHVPKGYVPTPPS